MGTPNNQQEVRTAEEVLRELLSGADHLVRESDLQATEMDVAMLEATFEQDVRQQLDYLHGYKPLETLDPVGTYDRPGKLDRTQGTSLYVQTETWLDVLGRYGVLRQHHQTLGVLDACAYCYDRNWHGPENVRFRISLTRKGIWILWFIELEGRSERPKIETERLSVHRTIGDLWSALQLLSLDQYTLPYPMPQGQGVPLSVEQGLRRLLKQTIAEREKRLESMKSALDSADRRVSIVRYYR